MESALNGRSLEENVLVFAADNQVFPGAVIVKRPANFTETPTTGQSPLEIAAKLLDPELKTVREAIIEIKNGRGDPKMSSIYRRINSEYIILLPPRDFARVFSDFFISTDDLDPFKHLYSEGDVKNIHDFYIGIGIQSPAVKVNSPVTIATQITFVDQTEDGAADFDVVIGENDKFASELREYETNQYEYPLSSIVQISKKNGKPITDEDFQIIFEKYELSSDIPYVFYRDHAPHYKVSSEFREFPSSNREEIGVMYLGDVAEITLATSTISLTGIELAVLAPTLTSLGYSIGESRGVNVQTSFEVRGMTVDHHIFHDMILNDPFFAHYLSMRDSKYKLGDSTKLKMFYKQSRVALPGIKSRNAEAIEITISNVFKSDRDLGMMYAIFTLEKATSTALAEDFFYNIVAIAGAYVAKRAVYVKEYIAFFGEELVEKATKVSNLDRLGAAKHKHFRGRYTSLCVGPARQPTLIDKEKFDSLSPDVKQTSAMRFLDPDYPNPDDDPNPTYLECQGPNKNIYLKVVGEQHIVCCKPSTVTFGEKSLAGKKVIMNTSSSLTPGSRGHISGFNDIFFPYPVKPVAAAVVTPDYNPQIQRFGIPQDGNAFLLAIAESLRRTPEQIRGLLGKYPAAYKQSMYDQTDEEIISYVKGSDDFDSDLVADGISSELKVNIVVLEIVGRRSKIRFSRHRFAYYRTLYSAWKTIFIYRHEKNGDIFYEPVFHYTGRHGQNETRSFVGLARRVTDRYNADYETTFVDTRNNEEKVVVPDTFVVEKDDSDWEGATQIIDGYGKVAGEIRDEIPIFYNYRRDPVAYPYVSTKSIKFAGKTAIVAAFPDAKPTIISAITRTEGRKLEWVKEPIDYKDGGDTIPVALKSPVDPSRYAEALRIRSVMLQYVSWLFIIHSENKKSPKYVDSFAKLLTIDAKIVYDFEKRTIFLPPGADFASAMAFASKTHLVVDGKLVVPTENILAGVVHFLNLMVQSPGRYDLPGYITDETETTGEKNEIIFHDDVKFDRYIGNLNSSYGEPVASITPSMSKQKNPYLVRTPEGKIYIVQNVNEAGGEARAMNCAAQWYNKRVNTGYNTSSLDAMTYSAMRPYITEYSVEKDLTFSTRETEGPLKILFYGGNRYAAILEIAVPK